MIIPVILCGGAGTRLWPASRDDVPKPFLPLVGGKSTFDLTLGRLGSADVFGPVLIVANSAHVKMIRAAMARAGVEGAVLAEPDGRDTAGAIAAASAFLSDVDERAVMLVLPADHLIRDAQGFADTVAAALPVAEKGSIVVFGVRPDRPATTFGYIQPGEELEGHVARKVRSFVEKPERLRAGELIEQGCLWNAGMFLAQAGTVLGEIQAHAPAVMSGISAAVHDATSEEDLVRLSSEPFLSIPRVSFDVAVMEKTGKAAVVEARFDWSDLGTWDAVWSASERDGNGNALSGDVTVLDARNNVVSSDGQRIGVFGVENLAVVACNGGVLVAPRARADELKDLVSAIQARAEQPEADFALRYRPWGSYRAIDIGEGYQTRRVVVNPGERLFLQQHSRREEQWTVVAGTGEATVGMTMDSLRTVPLAPGSSVHIPLGAIHRLANTGDEPLAVIEVQVGEYIGEDDIIRHEEAAGR